MSKKAFLRIFVAMIKKIEYFYKTSIYAVRRNLDKKVDDKLYFSKPFLTSLLSSLRPAVFTFIN
jgi:hypothetical protein